MGRPQLELFNRELEKACKDLTEEQVRIATAKIALEAFWRIIFKTPVDTGRARGGWQLAVNSPPTGQTGIELGRGSRQLSDAAKTLANAGAFALVYIQNNVEYISYLEDGWSDQAPKGMVMLTVQELRAMFK